MSTRLRDAGSDRGSTIAVIDEAMHEVRVFTTAGQHLQTIGRGGRGPGEFRRPVVRAYRTSGELVWRVRVPEYRTNIIYDIANGFQMERSSVGVDADASLVRVTESGVLAQWTSRSVADVEARAAASQVNSVWIDATTGEASNLGSGLPRIAATRSGTALVMSPEPIPQLMVHSLRLQR